MLPVTTNRQETVAEIIAEMRSGGLEAWETPADGVFALRCADRIEAALKRERVAIVEHEAKAVREVCRRCFGRVNCPHSGGM